MIILKNWLNRFMVGRYGSDSLNKALLWVYLALALVSFFVQPAIVLGAIVLVIIFFRMFSKNIAGRYAENQKYLQLAGKFKGCFSLQKRKWNDRKTHRYRNCPACRATLRLPYKKGTHTVCCPKCRHNFQVKI